MKPSSAERCPRGAKTPFTPRGDSHAALALGAALAIAGCAGSSSSGAAHTEPVTQTGSARPPGNIPAATDGGASAASGTDEVAYARNADDRQITGTLAVHVDSPDAGAAPHGARVVRLAALAHDAEARRCYEAGTAHPGASAGADGGAAASPAGEELPVGRVSLVFDVAPDGAVSGARVASSPLPPAVGACLVAMVSSWHLPNVAPASAHIEYPFLFRVTPR